MNTAPLARALTKPFFTAGAPLVLVLPLYIIPGVALIVTGWLWELFIPGAIIHIWIRLKFRKDEYWLANMVDALKEEQYLQP